MPSRRAISLLAEPAASSSRISVRGGQCLDARRFQGRGSPLPVTGQPRPDHAGRAGVVAEDGGGQPGVVVDGAEPDDEPLEHQPTVVGRERPAHRGRRGPVPELPGGLGELGERRHPQCVDGDGRAVVGGQGREGGGRVGAPPARGVEQCHPAAQRDQPRVGADGGTHPVLGVGDPPGVAQDEEPLHGGVHRGRPGTDAGPGVFHPVDGVERVVGGTVEAGEGGPGDEGVPVRVGAAGLGGERLQGAELEIDGRRVAQERGGDQQLARGRLERDIGQLLGDRDELAPRPLPFGEVVGAAERELPRGERDGEAADVAEAAPGGDGVGREDARLVEARAPVDLRRQPGKQGNAGRPLRRGQDDERVFEHADQPAVDGACGVDDLTQAERDPGRPVAALALDGTPRLLVGLAGARGRPGPARGGAEVEQQGEPVGRCRRGQVQRSPQPQLGLLVGEPGAGVAGRVDGEPRGAAPPGGGPHDPRRVFRALGHRQRVGREVGEAVVQRDPAVLREQRLERVAGQDVGEPVPTRRRPQQPGGDRGLQEGVDLPIGQVEHGREQVGRDVAADHRAGLQGLAGCSRQDAGAGLDRRRHGRRDGGGVGQAQHLGDEVGVAVAPCPQAGGVDVGVAHGLGHLLHRRRRQPREPHQVDRRAARQRRQLRRAGLLGVPLCGDDEDGRPGQHRDEEVQQQDRGLVGTVDVVQQHHERARMPDEQVGDGLEQRVPVGGGRLREQRQQFRRRRPGQRPDDLHPGVEGGCPGRLAAQPPYRVDAPLPGPGRDRRQQRRLADAGFPADEHEPAPTGEGVADPSRPTIATAAGHVPCAPSATGPPGTAGPVDLGGSARPATPPTT